MKKKILNVLTDDEKRFFLSNVSFLLESLLWIDPESTECKVLKNFVKDLFKNVPESTTEELYPNTREDRSPQARICTVCKQFQTYTYYPNGKLLDANGARVIMLDPWTPKDPDIIAEANLISQKNEQEYEAQRDPYKNIQNDIDSLIKRKEREFLKDLASKNYLFVKYQLREKFGRSLKRTPKSLTINGVPIYKIVNFIKAKISAKESFNSLYMSVDNIVSMLRRIFNLGYNSLCLKYFHSQEDLEEAWRVQSITVYGTDPNTGWNNQRHIISFIREKHFQIQRDPILQHSDNLDLPFVQLLNWTYTLQKEAYAHRKDDPELKDFLIILGICSKEMFKDDT